MSNSLYEHLKNLFIHHKNDLNNLAARLSPFMSEDNLNEIKKFIDNDYDIKITSIQIYKDVEQQNITETVRRIANGMLKLELLRTNTKFYFLIREKGVCHDKIMQATK